VQDDITQIVRDYMMTFTSDHGQRVLKDMMARGYIYSTTHVEGQVTQVEQNMNEGRREAVLEILSMVYPSKGPDNVILETLLDNEAA